MRSLTSVLTALILSACSFGGVEDDLQAQEEKCNSLKGVYSGLVKTSNGPIESEISITCKPTNNGTDTEGNTRVLMIMEAQVRLYDVLPYDVRLSVTEKAGNITLTPPKNNNPNTEASANDDSISFQGTADGQSISGEFLEGGYTYGFAHLRKTSDALSTLSSDRWTQFLNCYEYQLNRVAGDYEALIQFTENDDSNFMGPPAPRAVKLRLQVEQATAQKRLPQLRGYYVWADEGNLGASERPLTVDIDPRKNPVGITMTTPANLNVGSNSHKLYVNIVGSYSKGEITGSHFDWRAKKAYFKAKNPAWQPTEEKCPGFRGL